MTSIDVIDEVQQNFIDSSYDVNTNRAFPDVRDGYKPGQRCILWDMYTKKYTHDKPHVKSAKIDGSVAALYWPHGTTAIYETFARMSQPFTQNVPDVEFHGANGNIILGGDAIAADRYTEVRLSKITEDYVLKGIEKDSVPMTLNFSEDEHMPVLLPSVFPRLLVNGAQGIGVSVANVWLPHNLTDTINLIGKYIRYGKLDDEEYYPDFPTGGVIINKDELSEINKTGKGKVILEAAYRIDGKEIIFYEMPYQVYIEPTIEKIKEQIEKGNLNGVKSVFNKSDKNQIALVIECQRNANPEEVLEQLFQYTPLRSQYNANQNGIISKTPILLNLQQTVDVYVKHNLSCIKREHKFDLKKAKERMEILQGLHKALASIDNIISIIRKAENSSVAKSELVSSFGFTENQAKAILDMKLSKLTRLDGVAIDKEIEEKNNLISFCEKVIASPKEQEKILLDKLRKMGKEYKSDRRTKVINKEVVKTKKATASKKEPAVESVVIAHNPLGYIQRIPVSSYKKNNFSAFKTDTTKFILLFSNFGKFYRVKVGNIKSCGSSDKGTAIGTLIKLEPEEKILMVLSNAVNEKKPYLAFAMENGQIKKTKTEEFVGKTQNLKGMVATKVDGKVADIAETNGNDLILETDKHMFIRFDAEEVRATGRNSFGVKGITLQNSDHVVYLYVVNKGEDWNGIPLRKRGGKGHYYEFH
uniref:DNA topoisomerase (ATP-hydrolyzing) n=1 Tax=Siphoviridae sp. ctZHD14 TaxID=2827891 RepID=A0A8S5SVS1_9CAUD|nr:MAG TPA: DNA topoisomerase 2 alpha [Siphoviridae sp. ctZHD14]